MNLPDELNMIYIFLFLNKGIYTFPNKIQQILWKKWCIIGLSLVFDLSQCDVPLMSLDDDRDAISRRKLGI